jgi:hypothetical protein
MSPPALGSRADGTPVELRNHTAAGKALVVLEGSAPGFSHRRTGWWAEGDDAADLGRGCLSRPGLSRARPRKHRPILSSSRRTVRTLAGRERLHLVFRREKVGRGG